MHTQNRNSYIVLNDLNARIQNTGHDNLVADLLKMKFDLLSLYDKEVERWVQAMDLYDEEITSHTLRVTAISLELGRELGLELSDLSNIQYGTLLHDIGKLGIPDAIIQKPGKLTKEEYQVVQKHPIYAHEWISKRDDFQGSTVIPLFHHERWDGEGYPYRLKGKEIPLLARIVAIVDVWDAVTSDRPYRRAMTNEQAHQIIKSESGKHFDPDVVKAFWKLGIHEKKNISYANALIY